MTPVVELDEGAGVRKRIANADEGAQSATAANTTEDRITLSSIFFTLTEELRACWQPAARRVNDTSGDGSAPGGGCLEGCEPVWTAHLPRRPGWGGDAGSLSRPGSLHGAARLEQRERDRAEGV